MHSYFCPYCDWETHNQSSKNNARQAFFSHLDMSGSCSTQFKEDKAIWGNTIQTRG